MPTATCGPWENPRLQRYAFIAGKLTHQTVDLPRIELGFLQCECSVLPLNYKPFFTARSAQASVLALRAGNSRHRDLTWINFAKVPDRRIELRTRGFSVLCSTTELIWQNCQSVRHLPRLNGGAIELPWLNLLNYFWWVAEDSNL